MSIRVFESRTLHGEPRVFYASDEALRCRCGRKPVGVGMTEAQARESLAKAGRCWHRWTPPVMRLRRWWRRVIQAIGEP